MRFKLFRSAQDQSHAPDDSSLPAASDIYGGNEAARTADSIAIDFGDWLKQNEKSLFSMTAPQAVNAVIRQVSVILRDHGGQNGRRFSADGNVMYLHLETRRLCSLREARPDGSEVWTYDHGACEMTHPW